MVFIVVFPFLGLKDNRAEPLVLTEVLLPSVLPVFGKEKELMFSFSLGRVFSMLWFSQPTWIWPHPVKYFREFLKKTGFSCDV